MTRWVEIAADRARRGEDCVLVTVAAATAAGERAAGRGADGRGAAGGGYGAGRNAS
jgi:hypothetical protein